MADRQHSPTDTVQQANKIHEAWENIDPNIELGGYTLADLTTQLTALDSEMSSKMAIEDDLISARNKVKAERHTLWEILKRVKSAVKGKYGDDSDEYERVGGTRLSERKRRQPIN